MSVRLTLWLWAMGIVLTTATNLFFVWQFQAASLFSGLSFELLGLWILYGSAIATAHGMSGITLKLYGCFLVPFLSAGGVVAMLPDPTGRTAVTLTVGIIVLLVFGIALFCWEGDRESRGQEKAAGEQAVRSTD